MSRRISDDFKRLNDFFSDYTLKEYLTNEDQIDECKTMHKKLYGLMIFVAEFNQQTMAELNQQTMYRVIINYLNEMVSDLLLSMFNWFQGMYKPAKLELRCSIENFLKALQSVDNPKIIEEKSIYAVFDAAKNDKHFNNTFGTTRLEQFRNDYSTLCRVVHSAPQDIHSMSALQLLPQYDADYSNELVLIFNRTLENSMGILYVQYPHVVDQMHPENKKDFLDCLSKSTKTDVNEYLFD